MRKTNDPKKMDNEQFVQYLITRGSPLRQPFILEAIAKYAKACAEADPKTFESDWLSGLAWVQTAKEIHEEMEQRFK